MTEDHKTKARARAYLREYLRRGKIKQMPCIACGNPNSEGHHQDYTKPLEVVWLCKEHHAMLHSIVPTFT
jgi:hypothetical protein